MAKFYAVRKGRNTGIYDSWNECKKQIEGFKGAIYKSFSLYEDAEKFINEGLLKKTDNKKSKVLNNDNKFITAYVDGSYSELKKMYSYGVVLIYEDKIITFSGKDNKKENLSMRNVAGELLGAMESIKWAISNKFRKIQIYYDYEGIEKWATGIWKTNKYGTIKYKEFINSVNNIIEIEFIKVKAHTGVEYNEQADKLAKSELENVNVVSENNIISNEYLDIFNSIINIPDRNKNKTTCEILFNGLVVTEAKLKKVAKNIWKLNNRDIKEIESIDIKLDIEMLTLQVNIKDIQKNMFEYKIFLN